MSERDQLIRKKYLEILLHSNGEQTTPPFLNVVEDKINRMDRGVVEQRWQQLADYKRQLDPHAEAEETTPLLPSPSSPSIRSAPIPPFVGVGNAVGSEGAGTTVSDDVGVEMKDPLRKRKYQRATAEETKGRVEERFRGTGGYGVSRPPRQGSPEMFRGGVSAKTWTISECRGRARELGWDVFTGGGKHPYKFRYTGENPDLVGRTFTWINGGPNTDVSPDRLKQLMTNCGYYD
jgi:hypothetical protein